MFKSKKVNKKQDIGLFKSIYAAYFILLFHVVMIGAIGVVIVLFNGVINNIIPILLICGLLFLSFGYFLFRLIKRKSHAIKDIVTSEQFSNRSVELSLFGGFASVKLGAPVQNPNGVQIEGTSEKQTLLDSVKPEETIEFKKARNIMKKKHRKPDEYDSLKRADGS